MIQLLETDPVREVGRALKCVSFFYAVRDWTEYDIARPLTYDGK